MAEIGFSRGNSNNKAKGLHKHTQAHYLLQKHFSNFERYYTEKYDIDPFSEEFVENVFREYEEKIKNLPRIKVVLLPEEEADEFLAREIYGFADVKTIRTKYLKDRLKTNS
jgi:hypothetical protein